MSNTTYVIKPGDTLLGIAIEQNVNFTTLLQLNPQYQPNPDALQIGGSLLLPGQQSQEPVTPELPVEPVANLCLAEKGSIVVAPLCAGKEIADVIFATGESANKFYCLPPEAIAKLDEELTATQKLFQCYSDVVNSAPTGTQTWAELEQHAQQRQALCMDLSHAGVLPVAGSKNPASNRAEQLRKQKAQHNQALENQRRANAKVTELKKRIDYIEQYSNWSGTEVSAAQLKQHLSTTVIPNLKAELAKWELQAAKASAAEQPGVQDVNTNKMSAKTTALDGVVNKHSGIRELYSINRGVYVYVREAFFQRETSIRNSWRTASNTSQVALALKNGDFKGVGKAIAGDISEDVEKKILSPDIKANLLKWQAPGGKLAEWKATQSLYRDDQGNSVFAVSSEAQLGRWGMQAAIDTEELNPFEKDANGNAKARIDLGIGAKAAFSAFEAAVTADGYLPSDAGYSPCLSYTDANGQPASHSFGSFRFHAQLRLGCFVGVTARARAEISNKQPEAGDDLGILFDPNIKMGNIAGGRIGLAAGVFGGGQLSGEFSGGIEWKAPEQEVITAFAALAVIKTEGNVSVGGGYNADFELYLDKGKFFLKISAKLVWGVGGGGGFSVAIDVEQIWELVKVIWQGLQYIDYRQLQNINNYAYQYLVDATYFAFAIAEGFVSPMNALQCAIIKGEAAIAKIQAAREDNHKLEQEAQTLAERILDDKVRSGVAFDQLLPEAIGRMLDTLTRTFVFNWEENQEAAICILLKESTYSWHKFSEILARMNPQGQKQAGERTLFKNMQRINAILDGQQQNAFNLWVATLAEKDKAATVAQAPFTPYQSRAFAQKRTNIEQQYASLYGHHNQYPYV